jgi:MFS transporter, DHA1 family, staphyloferrin A biosynthesis exporter
MRRFSSRALPRGADLAVPDGPTALSGGRIRPLAALRHRNFALLWLGTGVMSAGQWLQQVTLSWLVFEMTGSAFQLGVVNGLRMAPFIVTSLWSGVLADRVDRRRLLLVTQVYLALSCLVIALLLIAGRAEVWHLYAFTFISGVGWSFSGPVRQALVPSLVPRPELLNAISLTSAAFNLTRMLGPAIGGLMIAAFGGGATFLVQAALYAGVVLLILPMRLPPSTASASSVSALESMREGLRYVAAHPPVLSLLLLALVPMTLGLASYQGLLPIFAAEIYGIGAVGLGVLLSASGLGSFIATAAIASLGDLGRKGQVQIVALLALGLLMAGFGLTTWLPAALLFLLLAGAAQMAYMTLNQTLLQTSISDEVRGRVSSLYMLNNGLVPGFAFAAGAIAAAIGAQATITLMGVSITAITLAAVLRFKHLFARDA